MTESTDRSLLDMIRRRGPLTVAEVTPGDGGRMPVLKQHSCPYYELAETDRAVCAMERKMFEKVLGRGLRLSQCRLDGHRSCDFEAKPIVPPHPVKTV